MSKGLRISWMFIALCAFVALGYAQSAEKPPELIPLDQLPKESSQVTAWKKAIEAELQTYGSRLTEMNDWMYHHPEAGHQEFEASKLLGGELEKQGFEVEYGVKGLDPDYLEALKIRVGVDGLPTAFVARYKGKTEAPVIAWVVEADALRAEPEVFHGCQHNQQGPAGVGGAVALSRVMEKNGIAGSMWVVLTPAEEFPPPVKAAMVKAGVFDDVDFVIRSHGTPHQSGLTRAGLGNCCMLIEAATYHFKGRPAHGARAWYGHDALDAARLFFNAVDALREHSEPTFRFMGTITQVGSSPNVINESVEVDHWIRNSDRSGLEDIKKKLEQVDTIAKGIAMATFTDVDILHYGSLQNGVESGWLQALAWNYINEYGDKEAISDELRDPSGWDEAGFGGVAVPGVGITPAVASVPEVSGHSHENAAITISSEGHKGLVQTSLVGAVVALRLFTDPELRQKVKTEHANWLEWGLQEGYITPDMIRMKEPTN